MTRAPEFSGRFSRVGSQVIRTFIQAASGGPWKVSRQERDVVSGGQAAVDFHGPHRAAASAPGILHVVVDGVEDFHIRSCGPSCINAMAPALNGPCFGVSNRNRIDFVPGLRQTAEHSKSEMFPRYSATSGICHPDDFRGML